MDSGDTGEEKIGSFYMGQGRRALKSRTYLSPGIFAAVIAVAFGGILWYAYPRGAEKYSSIDVPVIKADTAPILQAPADPGGIAVPHQDSTVFDQLTKDQPSGTGVEKLLPPPEEPMDKDKIIPPPVEEVAPAVPQKAEENVQQAPIVSPPAAEKSQAAGGFYIQLGAFREEVLAQKEWQRLQKKYPDFLKNLPMRTSRVDIPGKGVFYRLQAGVETAARAQEICVKLKPAACTVVK